MMFEMEEKRYKLQLSGKGDEVDGVVGRVKGDMCKVGQ